jgi:hypothetical protein
MSRRQILIAALVLVVATAGTVAATFFVIKRLVTVDESPARRPSERSGRSDLLRSPQVAAFVFLGFFDFCFSTSA